MLDKPTICSACPAYLAGRGYVPGQGSPTATVALVGQGPGEAEAHTGQPFVGPSGRILERWLVAAGKARSEFWVDNVVRCWLPKPPMPKEVAFCKAAHLDAAISALPDLRVIVTLGMPAARAFVPGANEKIVGAPHPIELEKP